MRELRENGNKVWIRSQDARQNFRRLIPRRPLARCAVLTSWVPQ